MAFETAVKIPLTEGPEWLSHTEIYREGDEIIIQVVNKKGFAYTESRLSDLEFNEIADLVLTRSSMEKTI